MGRLNENRYRVILTLARDYEEYLAGEPVYRALLDAHDRAEAAEARVRELEAEVAALKSPPERRGYPWD